LSQKGILSNFSGVKSFFFYFIGVIFGFQLNLIKKLLSVGIGSGFISVCRQQLTGTP